VTWYFDPSGETVDVYDHEGSLVAEGKEFYGSWSGVPDVVFTVMDEQAVEAFQNGDTMYVLQTLRHGAFELIEEGNPT